MQWSVPEMWKGETVYIIGGGPSVNSTNLSLIYDKPVIACNQALELHPWPVCYFKDKMWFQQNRDVLRKFSGLKITNNDVAKDLEGIKWLKRHVRSHKKGQHLVPLAPNPTKLMFGNNSGLEACDLARLFGASRIILVGMDMRMIDGEHNFHDAHKKWRKRTVDEHRYKNQFVWMFDLVRPQFEELNIEIINATPNSALDCFPIMPLEEAITLSR